MPYHENYDCGDDDDNNDDAENDQNKYSTVTNINMINLTTNLTLPPDRNGAQISNIIMITIIVAGELMIEE